MFGSNPNLAAEIMEFRSYKQSDHDTIRAIQASAENGYVDGIPKHHLPSAFNTDLEEGASCIFVCDYARYIQMTIHDLHKVIRERHILITGVPTAGIKFNLNGLQTIGDIHKPRSIQSTL